MLKNLQTIERPLTARGGGVKAAKNESFFYVLPKGSMSKHEKTLVLRVQSLNFKLPLSLINSLVHEFIFVASSSYNITFAVVNSIDGPRIQLKTTILLILCNHKLHGVKNISICIN